MRKNNNAYLHLFNFPGVIPLSFFLILITFLVAPTNLQALAPESAFEEEGYEVVQLSMPPSVPPSETGDKIGVGMDFSGYDSTIDIVRMLKRNKNAYADIAGNTIAELQNYLKIIANKSPQLTEENPYFKVEFRANVPGYVFVKGDTVYVDVEILKMAPMAIKPLLAFLMWDKGIPAIYQVPGRKGKYQVNVKRFASLNSVNQLIVLNSLRRLNIHKELLNKLKDHLHPGACKVIDFMKKVGIKDSLTGSVIFEKTLKEWIGERGMFEDSPVKWSGQRVPSKTELGKYLRLIAKMTDPKTSAKEVMDFIVNYAMSVNDIELLREVTRIRTGPWGNQKKLKALLMGSKKPDPGFKVKPKRKKAAFRRIAPFDILYGQGIDKNREATEYDEKSPLAKAVRGICFGSVSKESENKLFNKIDLQYMSLLDIPIWPVDDEGNIKLKLVEWMFEAARSPPEEYFAVKKVSFARIARKHKEKIPDDTTGESERIYDLDIEDSEDGEGIVKAGYLKVPFLRAKLYDYSALVDKFVSRIKRVKVPRIIAIGDIHGDIKRLNQILKEIGIDQDPCPVKKVVFLGDYIHRESGSLKVLERIKGLLDANKAVALMGNHEARFIHAMFGNKPDLRGFYKNWIWSGGWALLDEAGIVDDLRKKGIDLKVEDLRAEFRTKRYSDLLKELKDTADLNHDVIFQLVRSNRKLKEWALWMLKNLKFYYIDENGTFYIHSGIEINRDGSITYDFNGRKGLDGIMGFQEHLDNIGNKLGSVSNYEDAVNVGEMVAFVSSNEFRKNNLLNMHEWFNLSKHDPQKKGATDEYIKYDIAEKVLYGLEALRVVTGHWPLSKDLIKDFISTYKGKINFVDFGISYEEKDSVEGGYLEVGNNGVKINLYNDRNADTSDEGISIIDINEMLAQAEEVKLILNSDVVLAGDDESKADKSIKDGRALNFAVQEGKSLEDIRKEVRGYGEDLVKEGKATKSQIIVNGRKLSLIIDNESKIDKGVVGELINEVLSSMDIPSGDIDNIPDTFVIAVLDSSSHVFEDHHRNGFIGVNRCLFEMSDVYVIDIMLRTGLYHELSHEISIGKGRTFEKEQMKRDAKYAAKIADNRVSKTRMEDVLRAFFGESIISFIEEVNLCRDLREIQVISVRKISNGVNNQVRSSSLINCCK